MSKTKELTWNQEDALKGAYHDYVTGKHFSSHYWGDDLRTVNSLVKKGYIKHGGITPEGIEAIKWKVWETNLWRFWGALARHLDPLSGLPKLFQSLPTMIATGRYAPEHVGRDGSSTEVTVEPSHLYWRDDVPEEVYRYKITVHDEKWGAVTTGLDFPNGYEIRLKPNDLGGSSASSYDILGESLGSECADAIEIVGSISVITARIIRRINNNYKPKMEADDE